MNQIKFLIKFFRDKEHNASINGFLLRLLIFFTVYSVISFLHSDITNLVYGYRFNNKDIYLSYFVFPVLTIFGAMYWRRINNIAPYRNYLPETAIFGLLGIASLLIPVKDIIFKFHIDLSLLLVANFIPFFLGFVFIFLAIFNLKFIKHFLFEIVFICGILISYLVIQLLTENYWMILSSIILYALTFFLPIFSSTASINTQNYNVSFEGFSVNIGPTCVGFYSLTTFTLLFFLSIFFILKRSKLSWIRTLFAFMVGIFITFVFNILRIGIIIMVGGFYSPKLALELFHEYLSAIFLILIFMMYIYFVIPKLIKR